MQQPATPFDELERIDALHSLQLLDTQPDERFDRLTRLTQCLFNVPTVLVSLVDTDRQWFKSAQGLAALQTPRNISFCGHAILNDSVMVVPDAALDQRFADNPLVTGPPNIRFYAGMPLRAPGGHKVGTLCLIDHQPRSFSESDARALADLAAVVNSELDNRGLLEAMRQSRENETRLKLITDSLPVLIGYIDKDQRFRFHNHAYEELLGLDFSQIKGQSLNRVLDTATYALAQSRIAQVLAGQAVHYEREHTTPAGERRSFAMQYFPRFGEGKQAQQVIGFFSLGTDITETKRIDQMKTEFISTVSHELRTPLTSIRGSLSLIAGGVAGELPDKVKSLIGIAKYNCERLIRLINDMLDSEKIESGQIRLDVQDVDMAQLVEQAIAGLTGFAEQHKVAVWITPAPDLAKPMMAPVGCNARVDPDRVLQVLTNLLSNAIKFSPVGGIVKVAIGQVANALPAALRVEVTDQGPGIDEEFKSRIFQKFSQSDMSNTRQKGGTGLGLNISRALVEQMQGRMGFESRPGSGCMFYFEVPASAD